MTKLFFGKSCRLSFLFVILFYNVLLSQESKTIFLKYADDLKGSEKDGEQIRELIGNVELIHGNIRLKCNHAIQYFSSNKVEASGNVIVYQDTLRLYSDRGVYFADTRTTVSPGKVRITDGRLNLTASGGNYDANLRRADFYKDVVVSDPMNTIYSDTMVYYRDSSKIFSYGNVKIISIENNSTAFSDSMEYYRRTKYSILRGNPQMIRLDTLKNGDSTVPVKIDTLYVKAKIIISDRKKTGSTLFAIDSVKLLRNELSIACNIMRYFISDSIFILEKEPVIWYEKNQIFSDSITVFLQNRSLKKIDASVNAFMLSSADTNILDTYNQIMGDTIRLFFSDNKLDSVLSVDKAIAFYYMTDSSGLNSAYKSAGDQIKIELSDKKVKEVKVLFGIESLYYPFNMINGRQKEYNLPRFKLLEHKPCREDYYKIKK